MQKPGGVIRARFVVEADARTGWVVCDRALPHERSAIAWAPSRTVAMDIARKHEVQRIADLARVARLGGLDHPLLRR